MAYFRLLHLSDLHIATKPNRRGLSHVRGLRSFVQCLRQILFAPSSRSLTGSYHGNVAHALLYQLYASGEGKYDGIVITGDLATVGTERDLAAARNFCLGGSPFQNANRIHSSIALLPGNHDRFRPPLNRPGSENFEAPNAFGENWRFQETGGNDACDRIKLFELAKGDASLSLLAADFTLKTGDYSKWSIAYLDNGRVYEERLRLLREKTQRERARGRAVVWLTHFPPRFPGLRRQLHGEEDLIKAARELEVTYILSGHTHKLDKYSVGTTIGGRLIYVICAGSALAYGEAIRSFYELDVEVDGGNVVEVVPRPHWHHALSDTVTGGEYHVFSPRPPAARQTAWVRKLIRA